MFLVKSVIPTEPIWTAFIASAAELKLRQPVPHTRPRPPALLPEISHPEAHETCWKHGGPMTNFGVPPRKEFQGAACAVLASRAGHGTSTCATCGPAPLRILLRSVVTATVLSLPRVWGLSLSQLCTCQPRQCR